MSTVYIDPGKVAYASKRLYSLCGTTEYEIPLNLRIELKELAAMLNNQEVVAPVEAG